MREVTLADAVRWACEQHGKRFADVRDVTEPEPNKYLIWFVMEDEPIVLDVRMPKPN